MAGVRSEHRSEDKGHVTIHTLPSHWRWRETIHMRFEDQSELMRMACQPHSAWTTTRVSRKTDSTLGTVTWDQAVKLATEGWSEGRDNLVHQTGVAALPVAAIAKGWQFDYAGAHPDVPRFLGGDMDCMVDYQPDYNRFRPVVRMVVSPITYGDVAVGAIINWGAALVSWIDELERSGRRVEVTWLSCSRPSWVTDDERLTSVGGPCVAFSFLLKAADQPVEIDRLAFWIMHPAAQRRMQFALKEQMDIEAWYRDDYGVPISNVSLLSDTFGGNALIFPVGDGSSSVEGGIEDMRIKAASYLQASQKETSTA